MIHVFFLLKKVLLSRSTFQALTKQATKGICIGLSIIIKELATFVAADHDGSVSEPFSPRFAKIATPDIRKGKN